MIGHIFQVTAFYFMFMAVVDVGLTRPQDILFRRTKESEAVAVEATRHLEQVVEQRTADLQMAKSEAEFAALQMKTIADTAADAVICIDGNMDVVFWNRAAEKIFGYQSDDAIGKPLYKFLPDANLSEYAEVIGQMGAADDTPIPGGSVQVQASHRGGSVVPLEIALSFWSLSGKRYATVVGRDMSERIRSEETLRQSAQQLAQVLRSVVETMGSAVEARDPYTQGHQRGVARVSTLIAREMGLGQAQVSNIEIAALVHDIGKLAIPATILNKPGPLTELEYEMVKEHPQAGYDILKHIDFGSPIAEVVLQHHERMDGSGYPQGVSGNSILPAARVLIVADVVEAICSTRPYRAALSIDEAMAELYNNITKYDYEVVKACERLYQSGELAEALSAAE